MKKELVTLAISILVCIAALAQQEPTIPIDSKVRIGKLDNGLTYYIRHNEEPKGQANFYIAQKVGSILEEEEQRGLAHFLEHMCFNGTQKFPGNGVVKYCEKIGVKFGGDLNAYTSFDETVYNIDNVPIATTPSAVDSCLWILHDWADGLLLTDEDIDHERGVIHEEWRSRSNPMMRMYDVTLPRIFPNNRYAERMPIGLMSVVDSFPYKVLRDYYEKWYRPDQQGIVVVGDFDVDEMEAKIKNIFGMIATPVNPAERYYIPVEDNQDPIVVLAKDKEQPYAISYFYFKHDVVPNADKSKLSYLLEDYAKNVIVSMLDARLEEMTQQPNPPFIQAGCGDDNFFIARTKDAFLGVCVNNEKDFEKGVTALYREILRVARNGFTASEYERAKANFLTQLESSYNERDKVKSASYCKQYVRHFIDNEPIPGIEMEYTLYNQLIPYITVENLNEMMKELVTDHNLVMVNYVPDKEGISYPSEAELTKMLADVAAETIAPYEDKVSNEPLIAKLPKAGKVKKTENGKFGYKILHLSNGATVYMKATDFKADQILMSAFSKGGTSLYDESEAINLKVASGVFDLGGLGTFSVTDLTKVLAGKKVSLNAYINTYSETMSGKTTPKDFETMMQLTYLYFTSLRSDEEAFESWKTRQKASLANADLNPNTAFKDTLRKELYRNNPRVTSMKVDDVDKVNYARIMQIAKERFSNAADFTFVLTGNIDEATMIPMIEQYIGALPSKKDKENFRDVGLTENPGKHENIFSHEMETPMTTVYFCESGKFNNNLKEKLTYSIAAQILNIIFTEEIREKEGGTYGVSSYIELPCVPTPVAKFQVYYNTDPDKVVYLNNRIDEIIKDFANHAPADANVAKVKEYMQKKHIESLRENQYFTTAIEEYVQNGLDVITDYEKVLESITAEEISQCMNSLLKQGNSIRVVMNGVAK